MCKDSFAILFSSVIFVPLKFFFIKMCHMRENPVEPHRYLSFLTIMQMAETFAHVLRINANLSICE